MSDWSSAVRRVSPGIIAATVCGVLLISFWVRSQVAARGKSSTYDEPMHALSAWIHWHYGDWRVNYEDPPLWHYWAALPNGVDAIKVDFKSPTWTLAAEQWDRQWAFTSEVLNRTDGNDGEAFVQRSRSMMIVLGVALGAVLAVWGYRVGGVVAATAAVIAYSFDPNFLGHAALVKNDVAMALCATGLCFAAWSAGIRVTYWNIAGMAVACGAAMVTKFSGALLAPLFLVALLGIRAGLPWPWRVLRWELSRLWQRACCVAAMLLIVGVFSYVAVWAAYGMSFYAMPDATRRLNTEYILSEARTYHSRARLGNIDRASLSDPAKLEALNKILVGYYESWKPDTVLRTLNWMLDHRLFPEAWLNGLMFVQARSYIRGSFLDGENSIVGFRSYFPRAMLYKTPLALIGGWLLGFIVAVLLIARSRKLRTPSVFAAGRYPILWFIACSLTPALIYMFISINTNLNIGFRHLLPIYPMLAIATAGAVAVVWQMHRWAGKAAACLLGLLLAAESLAISPDYITFFNIAAGGQRGGVNHLGDSNLDWGQDLPALAAWQKQNPDVTLYLAYFGRVDPAVYGIRYINMPGGFELNPQSIMPPSNAVLAISATKLQGIYPPSTEIGAFYQGFLKQEPTAVLGGTIYIFDQRKRPAPR